ncbi:MAG TPA: sulfatase-like hydrolase/transferase [Pirellulales bacterium]
MNLLVVVVDRLHAGFLGCYGNAWVATPHMNRLAAEGFLLDQAYVDRPDLNSACQTWWTGTHVLERQTGGPLPHLARQLKQLGLMTTCLTDEPIVAEHPLTREFDEVIRVGLAAGESEPTTAMSSPEESRLAHVFASAAQFLQTAREPFCLWLHSRGLDAPWDAPRSFREQYADEDEAPPPTWTQPPRRWLSERDDPDLMWGVCQAYAGQVSLLDECLGALFESLADAQLLDDTLLALVGARGFTLGRNGRLGDVDQALFGELVQTPLILRFPDGLGAAARSSSLAQACDLAPTLLDAVGIAPPAGGWGRSLLPLARNEAFALRDRLALVGAAGETGLRTPAWYLRMPAAASESLEEPLPELYAKPDDRWEVNDVADRCPEVVRSLQAAWVDLRQNLESGASLPPLDDSLVNDLRG